jgi:chromosome segregation ATPase
MAITVKYLEGLGIEKDLANKIFAERSEEIEAEKKKYADLEKKLADSNASLENVQKEFDALKETNASVEDYKAKFEKLTADVKAEKEKAEADRKAAEKASGIKNRFASAIGEKKFSHPAVESDYLRQFTEALEKDENQGKADTDIIHALTKDDAGAFVGITVENIPGGTTKGNAGKKYSSKADIMNIKDASERQAAISANPEFFTN